MNTSKKVTGAAAVSRGTFYEILETGDASEMSPDLRGLYLEHLLPLLRRLIPGGDKIEVRFLCDPARFEIRRPVA
jgi:hypothetical protein